jgi:ligand-binding sensor domain-containing protein
MAKLGIKMIIRRIGIILALPLTICLLFVLLTLAPPRRYAEKKSYTSIELEHFTLRNFFTNNVGATSGISYVELGIDGKLWLGTLNYGLCSFDRKSCTIHELSSAHINCITYNSSNDTLWVGTPKDGVKIYDGGDWTTFNPTNSGLSDNRIRAIKFDNQNSAWIVTSSGIDIYDGEIWNSIGELESDISTEYITEISFDSKGNAWIGTRDGSLKMIITAQGVYEIEDISELPSRVKEISFDSEGNAWVASGNMIYIFDEFHNIIDTPNYSFLDSNTSVTVISFDSMGRTWIGMSSVLDEESLAIIHNEDLYVFRDEITNFTPESVWDIEFDSQGYAWVATSNGLFKVPENISLEASYEEAIIIYESYRNSINRRNQFQILMLPIGVIWALIFTFNLTRSTQGNQLPKTKNRAYIGKWIVYGYYGGLINFGLIVFALTIWLLFSTLLSDYGIFSWYPILTAPITGLTILISGGIRSKKENTFSAGKLLVLSITSFLLWILPYIFLGFLAFMFVSH